MIDQDQLRLVAATAHVVRGAEVRLRIQGGEELVVSRHPASDLTSCGFRQLVIETSRPDSPLPSGSMFLAVEAMRVGGTLSDLGGGVLRASATFGREQRWLGTTLHWRCVEHLLASTTADGPYDDELEATIAPDDDLGVTLVRLEATSGRAALDLDRLAAAVSASLLAEELIVSVGGGIDASPGDAPR